MTNYEKIMSELCEDHNCKHCNIGNPCIGCADYDMWNDTCTSEGACGDSANKCKGTDREAKGGRQ